MKATKKINVPGYSKKSRDAEAIKIIEKWKVKGWKSVKSKTDKLLDSYVLIEKESASFSERIYSKFDGTTVFTLLLIIWGGYSLLTGDGGSEIGIDNWNVVQLTTDELNKLPLVPNGSRRRLLIRLFEGNRKSAEEFFSRNYYPKEYLDEKNQMILSRRIKNFSDLEYNVFIDSKEWLNIMQPLRKEIEKESSGPYLIKIGDLSDYVLEDRAFYVQTPFLGTAGLETNESSSNIISGYVVENLPIMKIDTKVFEVGLNFSAVKIPVIDKTKALELESKKGTLYALINISNKFIQSRYGNFNGIKSNATKLLLVSSEKIVLVADL